MGLLIFVNNYFTKIYTQSNNICIFTTFYQHKNTI